MLQHKWQICNDKPFTKNLFWDKVSLSLRSEKEGMSSVILAEVDTLKSRRKKLEDSNFFWAVLFNQKKMEAFLESLQEMCNCNTSPRTLPGR